MRVLPLIGLLILCLLSTGELMAQPSNPIPYQEGLTTNFITVDGIQRKYLVYRPSGMTSVRAVVTVLHGGGGLGLDVVQLGVHPLSVFRTVADSEKFLVIYPEGSLDIQGNPGWNDCRSDDVSGSSGDDLTFLRQLNSKLISELGITSAKMFLTGTSNGAVMTYAYAFYYPETVRAIAISSGNLPAIPKSGPCTTGSSIPLPILVTHGTSDPAMPANGGCVANLGGACNRGTVVSQAATITYWLQRNGLQNVTPKVSTFNVNSNDAGNVEKRVYSGKNPLVYFVLNGAGHTVPSTTVYLSSSSASGVQNRDIEFAAEVWKFFKGIQAVAAVDFDGDRKTDVAIYRPSLGQWWYLRSSDNSSFGAQFGSSLDKPVTGDFTGDGKNDIAIFRPSAGQWYVLRSEDSSYYAFPFGLNGDIPVPADYDGDGKVDVAVFRPSNGYWYTLGTSGDFSAIPFGAVGDNPQPQDFDGDGSTDRAVFRPNGTVGAEWWVLKSSGGVAAASFGSSSDIPAAADYTGDGRADMAFFRPGNGFWYVLRSESPSFYAAPFGVFSDIPTPGDFDGDGISDFAVFRPGEGIWYINRSSGGLGVAHFGAAGDKPLHLIPGL